MAMREDQTQALGTAPVVRLFFRLALPAVLAQMATLANNVVDRMWVGHIPQDGLQSLGAVGVCLPLQTLFLSLAILIAAGMGPTVSILLGKGERGEAGKVSGACFGITALVGFVSAGLTAVLCDWLLASFGAGGETLPFARSYLLASAWGLPFGNLLLLLIWWYNAQGYVGDGVALSLLSVGVNAALDPILIYPCGLGVTGAAVATNAGAVVALAWGCRKAWRDERLVRFRPADLVPRFGHWLPSATLGLSTWLEVFLESIAVMLVNASLLRYGGEIAVAAFSLYSVAIFVLIYILLGLSMGAQPIICYNYGAGDLGRVRRAARIFILTSFVCSLGLWAVIMLRPAFVWGLFASDRTLVDYAASKSSVYFAAMLVTGVLSAHLYVIRFLKRVKISLVLGVLKRLVLLLPLIFILPAVLPGDKTKAVLAASPLAEAAAFAMTAVCYFFMMRGVFAKGVK